MIWHNFISAVAICCMLFTKFGAAIFEEQLGEFDWKRESIGYVDRSLVINSMLVVGTDEGVLSSLNPDNGEIVWRVLLPMGTRILKMVEAEGTLVTLTSQPQGKTPTTSTIVSMRCWRVDNGVLLWDTLVSPDGSDVSADPLDLLYSSSSRQVSVLYGNTLHFFALPKVGDVSTVPTYWSWSAVDDLASAASAPALPDADHYFALSALIAPTRTEARTGATVRCAVGCVQSKSTGLCDGPVAVVAMVTPEEGGTVRASLDTFHAFPSEYGIAARDLLATVSSDASVPYHWSDVVFTSKAQQQAGMVVLSLGTQTEPVVLSYPTMLAETATQEGVVSSFVYVGMDAELHAAGTHCALGACSTVVLRTPSARVETWALEGLVHCGQGGEDWAAVHLSGHNFYDRVASSAQCLTATACQDGFLSGFSASDSSSQQSTLAFDLSHLRIALPPVVSTRTLPSNFIAAAGSPVTVRYAAALPGNKDSCSASLLVVLESGDTMLLRSSQCTSAETAAPAQVQWLRREALSRAKQVVVLDKADGEDEGAPAGGHTLPSFAERLRLQSSKIQGYFRKGSRAVQRWVDAARSVASQLSSAAAKGGIKALLRAGKRIGEKDLDKLRMFGFDKVAVFLCHSNALARQLSADSTDDNGVRFAEAGLQLVFVDLLSGGAHSSGTVDAGVMGALYLSLGPAGGDDPVVSFVRLLAGPSPAKRLHGFESSAPGAEVAEVGDGAHTEATVLVGTADGRTFIWAVNTADGSANLVQVQDSCAAVSAGNPATATCSAAGSSSSWGKVVPYTAVLQGGQGTSVQAVAATSALLTGESGAQTPMVVPVYSILHESTTESSSFVTLLARSSAAESSTRISPQGALYAHSVNRLTGTVTIYATGNSAEPARLETAGDGTQLLLLHEPVSVVASATFDPTLERIVDVTYPSAQDTIHARHSILGDDSVLLKYLNPHVALVTTLSAAGPADSTSSEEASGSSEAADSSSVDSSLLRWTLLDTVTGKVIVRLQQSSAAQPVHSIIVENHIVSTYWNAKAKRTELSSTALYEGVIDSTELTPFASSRTRSNSPYLSAAASAAPGKSAYSAVSPIAMQKTYVLPRAVTALHHTVTAHGLSNKNLLLGLQNGQVYSVDMRQVHPRRPFSDPSAAEKTEGLVRYSPFVTLMPLGALTHNYTLAGGVGRIVSSPSLLESSSLVLSFGGAAVDLHLNRVMPSQDFDLLSSDFNHALLVAILTALASLVLLLRNMQRRKHLSTVWA